jgi:hypothetical protein
MKKKLVYLASAALVAGLAACSSDELEGSSSLTLKSGELGASIQPTAATRVNIDSDYNITWDRTSETTEAIGVYGNSGTNTNFKYNLKAIDDDNKAYGVFTPATDANQSIPTDFVPTYAYYPYNKQALKKIVNESMSMSLASEIAYKEGEVPMPLVGEVDGSNIAFAPVASILKVTVINMPAGKTYAKLKNNGNAYLSGSGKVDLTESTKKLVLTEGSKEIKYTFSSSSAGDSKEFYFIVPAGDYLSTLTFTLGSVTVNADTDDSAAAGTGASKSYSAMLSIGVNEIYTKTLRYNSTSGVIEDDAYGELNDKLEQGGNDLTAKLTTAGTVYIPKTATQLDKLTLNLTFGEAAVSIVEAPDTKAAASAPKEVVLNVSDYKENTTGLTVNLPNSKVTIAPIEGAKEGKATIAKMTATTDPDILWIKEGITVSDLTISTSGNVYAEKADAVTQYTGSLDPVYEFSPETKKKGDKDSSSKVIKAPVSLFQLMFPQGVDPINIDEDTSVDDVITIGTGKTVDIILYDGKALSIGKDVTSVIKVSGTLNIKTSGTAKTGAISSETDAPAIVVEQGGIVNLQSGAISNSAAAAVKVNGGTLNVTGGSLSGKTSEEAIDIVSGSATINTNTDATAENAVADVKGNVKVAAGGTFTLTSGYVSGTVAAEGSNSAGSEAAPATAATVNIEGGTLDGTSASALTLKAQAAYAPVNATIKGEGTVVKSDDDAIVLTGTTNTKPSLTIENGTISTSGSEKNVIKDATAAASIQIKGGVIKNATVSGKTETLQGTAINLASGSDLTITGGSVLAGATTGNAAIDLTKGSLDIPSTGDTVTLQGANVISATSTGNEVNISLANANATYTAGAYTANSTGYALFNYNAGTAKIGTLSISAGRFKGDIISSGKEFISGGHFSQCTNNLVNVAQGTYLKEGRILSYVVLDDNSDEYYEVVINSKK